MLHEELADLADAEALVGGDADVLHGGVLHGALLARDEVLEVVDLQKRLETAGAGPSSLESRRGWRPRAALTVTVWSGGTYTLASVWRKKKTAKAKKRSISRRRRRGCRARHLPSRLLWNLAAKDLGFTLTFCGCSSPIWLLLSMWLVVCLGGVKFVVLAIIIGADVLAYLILNLSKYSVLTPRGHVQY